MAFSGSTPKAMFIASMGKPFGKPAWPTLSE